MSLLWLKQWVTIYHLRENKKLGSLSPAYSLICLDFQRSTGFHWLYSKRQQNWVGSKSREVKEVQRQQESRGQINDMMMIIIWPIRKRWKEREMIRKERKEFSFWIQLHHQNFFFCVKSKAKTKITFHGPQIGRCTWNFPYTIILSPQFPIHIGLLDYDKNHNHDYVTQYWDQYCLTWLLCFQVYNNWKTITLNEYVLQSKWDSMREFMFLLVGCCTFRCRHFIRYYFLPPLGADLLALLCLS